MKTYLWVFGPTVKKQDRMPKTGTCFQNMFRIFIYSKSKLNVSAHITYSTLQLVHISCDIPMHRCVDVWRAHSFSHRWYLMCLHDTILPWQLYETRQSLESFDKSIFSNPKCPTASHLGMTWWLLPYGFDTTEAKVMRNSATGTSSYVLQCNNSDYDHHMTNIF